MWLVSISRRAAQNQYAHLYRPRYRGSQSFNGAMTRTATDALKAAHEVVVSDLYAMDFNPVSDRRNFTTTDHPITFGSKPKRLMPRCMTVLHRISDAPPIWHDQHVSAAAAGADLAAGVQHGHNGSSSGTPSRSISTMPAWPQPSTLE